MSDRLERLRRARLYLVSDELPDDFVEAALRGGVDILQLRSKEADDERLLAVAGRWRELCARHGALLILNDRPDLVEAAGADGVHVGQDDMPVAAARALVSPERLLGLSTHSEAQVEEAMASGVDYIGVGPVNATPTKPGRPAVGLELVRYAAAHATAPFFAIGGIDSGNVGEVVGAGARRIAVVRAITEAADPEGAARRLREAVSAGTEAPVGAA